MAEVTTDDVTAEVYSAAAFETETNGFSPADLFEAFLAIPVEEIDSVTTTRASQLLKYLAR